MAREAASLAGDPRPVGVFDSGVGGLSVWREIARLLPAESSIYIADQAHIPYGPRSGETLRRYAEAIVLRLLDEGCKAIVVACNAASAAALMFLRERFPQIPFIGMEPAVKPAALATRSGVVAVLATPATLDGELYRATAGRYSGQARLIGEPCPGLVEQIENGAAGTPETAALLCGFLAPALQAGADQLVLACTHYPFVIEMLRAIVGPQVEVIDPAPAVARQLGRVLEERGLLAAGSQASARFMTSGDPDRLSAALQQLLGIKADVEALAWIDDAHLVSQAATLQA